MESTILDSDILSELLKQRNAAVNAKAEAYLKVHGAFSFSVFTYYEIIRGCREKNSVSLISRFQAFCATSHIFPTTHAIFDRAADLWVEARRNGLPHSDSDLLIGATALENNLTLTTGNIAHFSWMPGLKVGNWRLQQ
jgi:tRNA(fMet)-specific endonuclease VapC